VAFEAAKAPSYSLKNKVEFLCRGINSIESDLFWLISLQKFSTSNGIFFFCTFENWIGNTQKKKCTEIKSTNFKMNETNYISSKQANNNKAIFSYYYLFGGLELLHSFSQFNFMTDISPRNKVSSSISKYGRLDLLSLYFNYIYFGKWFVWNWFLNGIQFPL